MIARLFLLALLCGACATDRWNAYDRSSQDVVMEPSAQRYEEHIQLLESWAADTSQPMPPGLYAELAYWLAKVGRYPEADAALQQELARYPQAQKFLMALRALVIQPESGASTPAPAPVPAAPAPSEPAPTQAPPAPAPKAQPDTLELAGPGGAASNEVTP